MADKRKSALMAEARERARAAKGRRDAQRAAREQELAALVERFHLAVAEEQIAQAEAADAVTRQQATVVALSEAGASEAEIVDLCEVSVSWVRRAKRGATGTARSEGNAGVTRETHDDALVSESV